MSNRGAGESDKTEQMSHPPSGSADRANSQSGMEYPTSSHSKIVNMRHDISEEEIYEICYDYKARRHDECDLRSGSVVKVVEDAEKGWYEGLVDGKVGIFPKNYIRAIGPWNCKKIGKGEIQIGEGGAGHVYRATYLGKAVAFKKFLGNERDRREDVVGQIIDSLKQEAGVFARLRHANIVQLYGVCIDSLDIGLVLELCQGGTLSQVYRKVRNAAIPKRILVDWAQQMCCAMEAVAFNFVHGDFNMENVLVQQKVCFCALPNENTSNRPNADLYSHDKIQTNGVCSDCEGTAIDRLKLKLTNFSLSREKSSASSQSVAAGKSAWIAPEAYQKNLYSEYSDVWSFGVVLWELVTRKQPYEDVCNGNYTTIPFFVAMGSLKLRTTKEFPAAIAAIIKACLQMDPEKRPKFKEIRHLLKEYMNELLSLTDPAAYIEQQKLEDEMKKDMEEIKKTREYQNYEQQIRSYANNAPKLLDRVPSQKKIKKSQIGEPLAPRLLFHVPNNGFMSSTTTGERGARQKSGIHESSSRSRSQ